MDQSPLKRYDPPLKKGVKKINELQVNATFCFTKKICLIPMLDLLILVPLKSYKSKIGRVIFF
jgi:hypothetical protein